MFETIFQMRYYTQKYRFTSKTAKWNQKRNILFSSVKKTHFFLRKLTKMSKLMLCFSETPKTFTCIRLRQVTFFISGLKKVVRLKQCPLYGFRFRDLWKGETYRKQTESNVSVLLNKVSTLEHDRFMQVSL